MILLAHPATNTPHGQSCKEHVKNQLPTVKSRLAIILCYICVYVRIKKKVFEIRHFAGHSRYLFRLFWWLGTSLGLGRCWLGFCHLLCWLTWWRGWFTAGPWITVTSWTHHMAIALSFTSLYKLDEEHYDLAGTRIAKIFLKYLKIPVLMSLFTYKSWQPALPMTSNIN